MTPAEFRAIRNAADLTQQATADFLGVNLRTEQRYEVDGYEIPGPVERLMRQLERHGRDAVIAFTNGGKKK